MGSLLHPAHPHAAAGRHRALLLRPPELVAVCLEQCKCSHSGELATLSCCMCSCNLTIHGCFCLQNAFKCHFGVIPSLCMGICRRCETLTDAAQSEVKPTCAVVACLVPFVLGALLANLAFRYLSSALITCTTFCGSRSLSIHGTTSMFLETWGMHHLNYPFALLSHPCIF